MRGGVNDFGSSKAIYEADLATRCVHCGFRFCLHISRQMHKLVELGRTDPEWRALMRSGDHREVKRRLDELAPPVKPEETSGGMDRDAGDGACRPPDP